MQRMKGGDCKRILFYLINWTPMNTKQYQLDVCLKDAWKDVFSESYKIALRDTFVEGKWIKEQNFKNHVEGFVTQLKINCNALPQIPFKKRQVYVCSFWASAWSEIMGDRPVIVVKATHSTHGEDLLVVPLTSATQQKKSGPLRCLCLKGRPK